MGHPADALPTGGKRRACAVHGLSSELRSCLCRGDDKVGETPAASQELQGDGRLPIHSLQQSKDPSLLGPSRESFPPVEPGFGRMLTAFLRNSRYHAIPSAPYVHSCSFIVDFAASYHVGSMRGAAILQPHGLYRQTVSTVESRASQWKRSTCFDRAVHGQLDSMSSIVTS